MLLFATKRIHTRVYDKKKQQAYLKTYVYSVFVVVFGGGGENIFSDNKLSLIDT